MPAEGTRRARALTAGGALRLVAGHGKGSSPARDTQLLLAPEWLVVSRPMYGATIYRVREPAESQKKNAARITRNQRRKKDKGEQNLPQIRC